MTTNIATFKSVADFEALGQRIRQAAGTPYDLVQTGLIAGFTHLNAHGNVNVLKPIVSAIEDTFLNRGMVRRVHQFILNHTWLEYNVRNLRSTQLRDAQFDVLWTKNKSKSMDVDGAKAAKWYETELPQRAAKPQAADAYIKATFKRIQNAINGGLLTKGKAKATLAELRSEIRAAMEMLEAPKVKTVTTSRGKVKAKVTKVPAGTKSLKAKDRTVSKPKVAPAPEAKAA